MAAGKISIQANDGKVAGVVFEDGASSNVTVTVPKEGGVVATEAYADTKVSKTGDETIAGVKTFSSNTIFNGNVGIGITPSAWTNSRVIQLGSYSSIHQSDDSGAAFIGSNIYRSGRNINNYIISGWGATLYEQNGGNHNWYTAPSGTAGNTITWTKAMSLDQSGNLLLTAGTGGLGYGTGAGGTVTQLTSKSTAVTLNKPCGRITMHNAALAAGATASFILFNSLMGSSDTLTLSIPNLIANDIANYKVTYNLYNGGALIFVTNVSGSTLSEAISINFNVHKGALA